MKVSRKTFLIGSAALLSLMVAIAVAAMWERPGGDPKGGSLPQAKGPRGSDTSAFDLLAREGLSPGGRAPGPSGGPCGPHFASQGGKCVPIDLSTGEMYDEKTLALFARMLGSRFVSKKNFWVPQVLTEEQAQKKARDFEYANKLFATIKEGNATEDELGAFFNFQDRVLHYKMQIVTFLHAEATGQLTSGRELNLVEADFESEQLKEHFVSIQKEQEKNFEIRRKARKANGLPENEHVDWAGAR